MNEPMLLPFEVAGWEANPIEPGLEEYLVYVTGFREHQQETFELSPGLRWGVLLSFKAVGQAIRLVNDSLTANPQQPCAPDLWCRSAQLATSALHLVLAGCLSEGGAVARSAIEFAAYANYIHGSGEREQIYRARDTSTAAEKAFRNAFKIQEDDRLYKPIAPLDSYRTVLNDLGAHGSPAALGLHRELHGDGTLTTPFAPHDDRPVVAVLVLRILFEIVTRLHQKFDEADPELTRTLSGLQVFHDAQRRLWQVIGQRIGRGTRS